MTPEILSRFTTRIAALGRHAEARRWALLLVISAPAALFVILTREMLEGETRTFDEAVLLALRTPGDPHLPIGPAWLTKAMTDLTALGGTTVLCLVTLLTVLYLVLRRSHAAALFVTASVVGGWLISSSLKLGVARPRPDLVPHLVDVHDLSFPSGHAMLSAVTYLTLGALLSRFEQRSQLRIFLFVSALAITLLVGVSRIFLGVHYPTDVIGGWCAGLAWASFCWRIAYRRLAD